MAVTPITEATMQRIKTVLEGRNEIYKQFVQKYKKTTWDEVAYQVKSGKANLIYDIGDELVCNYRYYAANDVDYTDYDFPWVVADFREVEWQDGTTHPGMILQAKYCTIESMMFDASEQVACDSSTETVAEDGIYYFGKSGSTWTALDLSTGDTIPYGDYDTIYKNDVNNLSIVQNGYNNYKLSAQRQWLNSAGSKGEWWSATHVGDAPPSQLNSVRGFLNGLDDDFIAVVNPIKIQVARNTICDGGGIDVMHDKFFLPSLEEMYGVPQLADVEGPYLPYWKDLTGLSAPTNAANAGRVIVDVDNKQALNCRLRSANRGTSYAAWFVSTSGYLYYSGAHNSYRCAPACAIS